MRHTRPRTEAAHGNCRAPGAAGTSDANHGRMRIPTGFTLFEVIVVLAIGAVLLMLGWRVFQQPLAAQVAREVTRAVRHARWSAVTSGRPAILLSADDGRTLILYGDGDWRCDTTPTAYRVWESGSRRVALSWPVRGVSFAPDGFPRSCRGDGVGSATAVIIDTMSSAAVVVSALGRVRWEVRP